MKSYLNKNQQLVVIIFGLILSGIDQNKDFDVTDNSDGVRHLEVYYQDDRFAGWPANNGIWNWGDEILVGFVEAEHRETEGFHTYNRETARNKYARSLDGGETWSIEDAYDLGQTGWVYDNIAYLMKNPKNPQFWKSRSKILQILISSSHG